MVKRCQWGLCDSDDRYPERLVGDIKFIPFPKPKRNLDKCKRWIKACNREHHQLNVEKIDGNYHMYVCTKHFREGMPTNDYPDPVPADPHSNNLKTPLRRPPKQRANTEPLKKRRKIPFEVASRVIDENTPPAHENCTNYSTRDSSTQSDSLTTTTSEVSAMDLLALAAENHGLKTQVTVLQTQLAEKLLRNEELTRENVSLKKQLKETSKPALFSVNSVKNSKQKNNFKYYTGFVYTQFLCILKFLVPNSNEKPFEMSRKLSSAKKMKLKDQLLMVLMKIRLNLQFHHLGTIFNLSQQDAGEIFREWINYMYYRFGSVPLWPSRSKLIEMMPSQFRKDFPTTMIILDGTEIKVERPSSLRSQSQCYSDYKSCTTLKGLVGVDPRGSFTFISMLYSGAISDNEITAQSGLYNMLRQLLECGRLQRGDGVMVDKGFLIKESIEQLGLELIIPPFACATDQMPPSDVSLTQKIAKHRVHVERAISRVKKFKIVDHKVDLSLFPCVNQIWFTCCFLTGFMPLLINDQK